MLLLKDVSSYLAEHPESICATHDGIMERFSHRLDQGAYRMIYPRSGRTLTVHEMRELPLTTMYYYHFCPESGQMKWQAGVAALQGKPFRAVDLLVATNALYIGIDEMVSRCTTESTDTEIRDAIEQRYWFDGGVIVSETGDGQRETIAIHRAYLSLQLNLRLAFQSLNVQLSNSFSRPRRS